MRFKEPTFSAMINTAFESENKILFRKVDPVDQLIDS
jgi:hypothetical protein